MTFAVERNTPDAVWRSHQCDMERLKHWAFQKWAGHEPASAEIRVKLVAHHPPTDRFMKGERVIPSSQWTEASYPTLVAELEHDILEAVKRLE